MIRVSMPLLVWVGCILVPLVVGYLAGRFHGRTR